MLELGMSEAQLAAKLHRSISTVRNMLSGKRVLDRTAYETARVLGVELRELAPETADRLQPPEAARVGHA